MPKKTVSLKGCTPGDCAQFCAPLPTETDCEIAVSIKAIGAFRPDDSAAAAIAEVVLKLVGSCVDIGPMPTALLRRFLLFLTSLPQQCDDDVYVSARIREQGFSSFGVEKFQMHGAFGCGSLCSVLPTSPTAGVRHIGVVGLRLGSGRLLSLTELSAR